MPEWITTDEGEALTGYTAFHIRRLIDSGEVNARKFGRTWQVDKKSLLAYVKKAVKLGEKRGPKTDR